MSLTNTSDYIRYVHLLHCVYHEPGTLTPTPKHRTESGFHLNFLPSNLQEISLQTQFFCF